MRRVLLKDVPLPPHLDFRDQHDEARRFGAGVIFQRLLRARLPRQKDLLRRKAPSCQPRAAEANFEQIVTRLICVPKPRAGGSPEAPSMRVCRLADESTALDHCHGHTARRQLAARRRWVGGWSASA